VSQNAGGVKSAGGESMMDESIQKPLVEQILDEMFAILQSQEEFDDETITKLKHLAASGDLQKPARVTQVIKSAPPPAP
jgi:hypothetical protein